MLDGMPTFWLVRSAGPAGSGASMASSHALACAVTLPSWFLPFGRTLLAWVGAPMGLPACPRGWVLHVGGAWWEVAGEFGRERGEFERELWWEEEVEAGPRPARAVSGGPAGRRAVAASSSCAKSSSISMSLSWNALQLLNAVKGALAGCAAADDSLAPSVIGSFIPAGSA